MTRCAKPLDDAVSQALNLDPEQVQTIRRNLAAEPLRNRQTLRRPQAGGKWD